MAIARECLQFFAAYIQAEIGIVYSEVNFYQLEGRLEEIAKQSGMASVDALWKHAQQEGIRGTTKHLLVDIATNNETSFFRDVKVFRAVSQILGAAAKTPGPFRIWSACCSSGQEVYSLQILMTTLAAKPSPVTIFATDISERILERAKNGAFSQLEVQRGLSAPQLLTHFEQVPVPGESTPQWMVKAPLKEGLTFRKLNLLEPWPGSDRFSLILCRNVLIYQTVENKQKVVAKLEERLAPGGYLVLGGAESLIGISDRLQHTELEGVVVYRKPLDGAAMSRAS